jgi:hypothetical protein
MFLVARLSDYGKATIFKGVFERQNSTKFEQIFAKIDQV